MVVTRVTCASSTLRLAQSFVSPPAFRELFSESVLHTLAFPDIGQQPLHLTRRLVSSQKFVRWHMVQISADRAAVTTMGCVRMTSRMSAGGKRRRLYWQ